MSTISLKQIFNNAKGYLLFLLNILLHLIYTTLVYMLNSSPKTAPSYENSATIHRVIWKRKWMEVAECIPGNFLTWPVTNVHPKYTLKPTVSLYCITKDIAVFVETSKDVDIYRSDLNPFLYISQFKYCVQVITMPMSAFNRLATETGDPSCQVILLSNTGRCGSTIVGQMFESVPRTLLLSESDALTNLAFIRTEGELSNDEYEEALASVIRITCKAHPNTTRMCIKPRSQALIHMDTISRLFPEVKQLFLYRNVLETVSSFLHLSVVNPAQRLLRLFADNDTFSAIVPFFRSFFIYIMCIRHENQFKDPQNMITIEIVTTMWASSVVLAERIKKRDNNLLPLKYEDLMANPQNFCEVLFKAVDIDVSMVKNALSALEKDSQKGTMFGERSTGKDPWRHFSDEDVTKVNTILSMYTLPNLGKEIRI